ncbi:MAG: hypothetical protein JXR48_18610 [Candidatus Delongbacteria bacterium]|nr:hypothetical protein [Candidatus Delongbacteria bacterium]MBN2836973.1 hypothetical protein [Candidatus Delongbacteria bacterium]
MIILKKAFTLVLVLLTTFYFLSCSVGFEHVINYPSDVPMEYKYCLKPNKGFIELFWGNEKPTHQYDKFFQIEVIGEEGKNFDEVLFYFKYIAWNACADAIINVRKLDYRSIQQGDSIKIIPVEDKIVLSGTAIKYNLTTQRDQDWFDSALVDSNLVNYSPPKENETLPEIGKIILFFGVVILFAYYIKYKIENLGKEDNEEE